MIARRLILGYIFFVIISSFCLYIFGIKVTVLFFVGVTLYNCVFFLVHRMYTTFKGTYKKKFSEYSVVFLYKFSIWTSLFIALIGYFIYHQNYLFPAQMSQFTLENEKGKSIIFQAMSHVGSEAYYKNVQESLTQAKKDNYVLFYEGVRPGKKENEEKFSNLLGIQLDANTYKLLASLYGIEYQNQEIFLGIENNKDYNVDLNIDEIIKIYEEKYPESSAFSSEEKFSGININMHLAELNSRLNYKEKYLLRQYNLALMNFMIKHESVQNFLLEKIGKQDIFSIILDERNKHLAELTLKNTNQKIFIMYGLLHFTGFYEQLLLQDPSWKITSTTTNSVFIPPVIESPKQENTEQEVLPEESQ